MSPRQHGFTLLEVLVAFVIAALAMAVLFQGALAGLRAASLSSQYEQALSLARSHLAELSQRQSGGTRDLTGRDGKLFRFRIRVNPVAGAMLQRSLLDVDNNRPARQANLYAIDIAEFWVADGQRREVRLRGETMVVQAAGQ